MADDFEGMSSGLSGPVSNAADVTPDGSDVELTKVSRALYVGGAGDVAVNMAEDGDHVHKSGKLNMSRPRLPDAVASITGADKRSPGRFKSRKSPKVKSLGPAPKRFTDEQKEIWNEFNADFPWLGRSDRAIVEVATKLTDLMRTLGRETPVAVYAQMRMTLGQMGGTPVDRSKVAAPEDEDIDPTDEFLN